MYKFGFIGTGNMGGALAAAVCKGSNDVLLADKDTEKAENLAKKLGCSAGTTAEAAEQCKYIFLGLKPQILPFAAADLSPILAERSGRFVIVTMAAGVSIMSLTEYLGDQYPVIRIMPNTPASVGEGMILYTANKLVKEEEKTEFITAMRHAGKLDELDENLIDAASAVSGCGPAFVYMFMEALADAGVECGLPRDKALKYAEQTVFGSAKLAIESAEHPGKLKDDVCSPGGTTIAGVHALEKAGFRCAAMDAVKTAYEKTLALAKK